MVKSIILMLTARDLDQFGYKHPMGPEWRGIMDFDPVKLSREKIIQFCADIDTQAIRDIFPVGTPKQVAVKFKAMADAGMRVFKVMDYGGMAGQKYGATSAQKVREVEDEVLRLCDEDVAAEAA
jgi:phthiodiolone/phenolphthiodiolone dimycocerosates ketoreductase